jgi:AcrR family transcriptional regulator
VTKVHSREQIVEVAGRVFAEKGYDNARLEDIASELGIMKGSLFHYISGKAELLYLDQRRGLTTVLDQVERIGQSELPPLEKFALAIKVHLRHYAENFESIRQSFLHPYRARLSGEYRDELRQREHQYVELLETFLKEAMAHGQVRADLNTRMAVYAVLSICNWLPSWYSPNGKLAIDEISAIFTEIILDGTIVRNPPAE